MSEPAVHTFISNLLIVLLLSFSLDKCCCSQLNKLKSSVRTDTKKDELLPMISPSTAPQPFLPLLAPSPLTPFTNNTTPKLSGMCVLNFTAVNKMMTVASTDCMTTFAPFLANVMCCPQLEATLAVLIGQSSNYTNTLALNSTQAKHCLSDFSQILVGKGADNNLKNICSVQPSNLTSASCPVINVDTFEKTVDTEKLLSSCEKIDLVNECCNQICQNEIAEASGKLASRSYELLSQSGEHIKLSDESSKIKDCSVVVHRWLASKLEPSRAKGILRGLSNCNINKVCPLVFPSMRNVTKHCGNGLNKSNYTACCNAFESYMSHLQLQSFVTNLQALNCAASLGIKLQKSNVSVNVYNLCHVSLKDFSLQASAEGAGCLLPSLPSDATLDRSTGIGFVCDLNDNIPAPWPSPSLVPLSSCNKTVKIPALPAATSGLSGIYKGASVTYKLFLTLVLVIVL